MKDITNQQLGSLGEKLAAKYLKQKGYKILEKNYKCKLGEIDIIARDGEEIVFIEVKTRTADPYVRGIYAVDKRKQEHILRTASWYLSATGCGLQPRMDIIEIELDSDNKLMRVNHIESAFIQTGPYARY